MKDETIAQALWGTAEGQAVETSQPAEKPGPKTDRELGEALYGPAQTGDYARVDTNGRVEDLVRDTDQRILLRGYVDGHPERLVAQHPTALSHADLRGMTLPDLPGGNLREANCCGAVLKDLQGADLRGLQVDETTDTSQANFLFVKLDKATYERLRVARGFKQARNLARPFS